MGFIQTRFIIAIGFFMMGCALIYSSYLVPDIDFGTLVLMRLAQTAGLGFLFVPISTITYLTLSRDLRGDGAALFSMFRNVFGSIGISVSTALVEQHSQIEQTYLSQWVSPFWQPYETLLAHTKSTLMTLGHSAAAAQTIASKQVYQTFLEQVSVLAYADVFREFAVAAFLAVPLCFFLSGKTASGGPGAGH
jgi:DHA2 family multidrug resistance protein